MRLNSITHRRLSIAIVLFSWGSVGVALFTQHVLGMQPCPWCIAQRVLYLLCGALAILAVVSLFMFHAMHRLCHSLHDFGFHTGRGAQLVCYGFAALITIICALVLRSLQ